jgi:hypothetical protein
LLELQQKLPDRVQVTFTPLYGEDYYRHIACCNALLLPYPPDAYHARLSQVVMDAIAMATSCITCKGSSLEDDLRRFENGSIYIHDHTVENVVKALFEFDNNWKDRKNMAKKSRERMMAYHNKDTYLDVVFDVGDAFNFPDCAIVDYDEYKRAQEA